MDMSMVAIFLCMGVVLIGMSAVIVYYITRE